MEPAEAETMTGAEAGIGGGAIVAPSTELDGDFFLRAKSLV